MRFSPLSVSGARLVEAEPHVDERGTFARAWCRREFAGAGLEVDFVQANVARSRAAGTLRGLHWQEAPHAEAKLVRCTRGAVYDVIADVRPGSPTFLEWSGVELEAGDGRQVFVPAGCAHGYQALRGGTEIFYMVSAFYAPEAERGIRWDDPAFDVKWPMAPAKVSDKDRGWPPFGPGAPGASAVGGSGGDDG